MWSGDEYTSGSGEHVDGHWFTRIAAEAQHDALGDGALGDGAGRDGALADGGFRDEILQRDPDGQWPHANEPAATRLGVRPAAERVLDGGLPLQR
jgi:hypothetical protein